MTPTEVLAQHQRRGGILGCGCGWNWPEERTYFCGEEGRIARAHVEHQLDALRDAGFAVVDLPEVDDASPEVIAPAWSVREESGPIRIQQAKARDGFVEFDCEQRYQVFPPSEARRVAAALLAAADAAEAHR